MRNLPPEDASPPRAAKHATYSGYACYTGTCQHTPHDIQEVAYKVFLGQKQYLGCTDAGNGWQHWWAFLPDPPGSIDEEDNDDDDDDNDDDDDSAKEAPLERLQREFQGWSPEIHDLFEATRPEVVKRRDIYDRPPLLKWTDGYTTLLGDAAHATMPNLGQGGAMAIEDAYVLGQELEGIQHTDEIPMRLKRFESRRFGAKSSIAQFLSRNGGDLLDGWEKLRTTPIVGPIAMWFINVIQPITMNYLYSADF